MESLKFSVVRKEVPVELQTAEGAVRNCVLLEMSGKGRDEYLNLMNKRMKFDAAGQPVRLSSFEGIQAALLARCLMDVDADEFLKEEEIQTFPASVINRLFEAAQELNGLDIQAKEEAKND